MTQHHVTALRFVPVFIVGILASVADCHAQQLKIVGIIRLRDTTEMEGALVRVFHKGIEITRARSGAFNGKSKGYYELSLRKPMSSDSLMLRVDPPNLNTHGPVVVTHLSDRDDQNISVVVFDRKQLAEVFSRAIENQKVDVTSLMSQYASLSAAIALDLQSGVEAKTINLRYGELIRDITASEGEVRVARTASAAVLRMGLTLRRSLGL